MFFSKWREAPLQEITTDTGGAWRGSGAERSLRSFIQNRAESNSCQAPTISTTQVIVAGLKHPLTVDHAARRVVMIFGQASERQFKT